MTFNRVAVTFIAATILLTGQVHGQAANAQRKEVQDFIRAYADAANRSDLTAYMEMYSTRPDLMEVNDGEITRGLEAVRTEANNMMGLEGRYKISVGTIDVITLGTTRALAVFPFVATVTGPQGQVQVRGAMTVVLEKGAHGWKIIHDHTSAVPPPAPGQ